MKDELISQRSRVPAEHEVEWSAIADNLNAAMDGLSAKDREAILLRFFDDLSMRETADVLGVSEDAAKKRIGRALEKLRVCLSRRNVVVPAATLAILLTEKAVDAVPASCMAKLHAIAIPVDIAPSTASHLYAKGALRSMKRSAQLKFAGTSAVVVVALCGGIGLHAVAVGLRHLTTTSFYPSLPAPAAGWVLKHHFVAGDTLSYNIVSNADITTTLPSGSRSVMHSQTGMSMTEMVETVRPDDSSATIGMQMKIGPTTVGGRAVAMPAGMMADLTRPATFVEAVDGKVGPVSQAQAAPGSGGFGSLIASASFPDKAVKPGDTWSFDLSIFGNIYAGKSTLEDVREESGRQVAIGYAVCRRNRARRRWVRICWHSIRLRWSRITTLRLETRSAGRRPLSPQ